MARPRISWLARLFIGLAAVIIVIGAGAQSAVRRHASAGLTALADELPTRASILRAAPGTYIVSMLHARDSTLSRWPVRIDDPIRVWVEPTDMVGFTAEVRRAFGEWSTVGLPLRFVFVDRPRDAEIRVRWTERLERKTGNTVWRAARDGWMLGSDVLLATHLTDGRVLDSRSLRAIALHEIGHALGLAHSDERHDIMAPLVRVGSLSDGDRGTARLLYTLPAGHLR